MKTNRDYFSWSQYSLWHASKREFWKRYNQLQEQKGNKFFTKGKELGSYMETGVEPHDNKDPMLTHVGDKIPKYDVMEQELKLPFGDTELLGYVDSGEFDYSAFVEYKTGKVAKKPAWTQDKVDEHDQLLFYAYIYLMSSGVVPKCKLIWIETMDTPNGLMYTGETYEFTRKFTKAEIMSFGVKIRKTIKEIKDFEYEEFEVSEVVIKRYIAISEEIAVLVAEQDLIKMETHKKLTDAGVTFGKGISGNFHLKNTKSWKYSDATVKLAEKTSAMNKVSTAIITKLKKLEQKDEVAKFTTNESIQFKQVKTKE